MGAVGTEVAPKSYHIDEMAEAARAAEEGNLCALEGDGDWRADRRERRDGPGGSDEASRVSLDRMVAFVIVGCLHHERRQYLSGGMQTQHTHNRHDSE